MKKNKILYLIIMITLLFSCKINVYAAQELTCLYQKISDTVIDREKVLLIQDKDGNIFLYKNKENVDIHDKSSYWERSYNSIEYNKSVKKNGDYLTECPKTQSTSIFGKVTFYGNNKGKAKLERNETKVIEPTTSETLEGKENGEYEGKSCSSISKNDKWQSYDTSTYVTSCLYNKDVTEGAKGCHTIQINIQQTGKMGVIENDPAQNSSIKLEDDNINLSAIQEDYSGECPAAIYVNRYNVYTSPIYAGAVVPGNEVLITSTVSLSKKSGYVGYQLVEQKGKNSLTGEELTSGVNVKLQFEKLEILNCEQLLGEDGQLKEMLKSGITIVKVAVPLLLIALGSLDFAKAVFAGSEDDMKKAQKKFIKRIIIGVAIFLIPTILKLVLGLANSIWSNIDPDLCGLL